MLCCQNGQWFLEEGMEKFSHASNYQREKEDRRAVWSSVASHWLGGEREIELNSAKKCWANSEFSTLSSFIIGIFQIPMAPYAPSFSRHGTLTVTNRLAEKIDRSYSMTFLREE